MDILYALIGISLGLFLGNLASMGLIKLFNVIERKYPVLAWVYMVIVLGSLIGLLVFAIAVNL